GVPFGSGSPTAVSMLATSRDREPVKRGRDAFSAAASDGVGSHRRPIPRGGGGRCQDTSRRDAGEASPRTQQREDVRQVRRGAAGRDDDSRSGGAEGLPSEGERPRAEAGLATAAPRRSR